MLKCVEKSKEKREFSDEVEDDEGGPECSVLRDI